MFFDIKATSMQGIEYELNEAILKTGNRYFGCTPKQYLTTTLGLGIKDFHDPKRAGRDMVRKMIAIGRLKEKQKRTGGMKPIERGAGFLHHTTWEKYKKCDRGKLLELNSKSVAAISRAMSQLTFRVAQQFWTKVLLEDMVALPFGVDKMFFTQTKRIERDSPFGNVTREPVCIVDAEKLLPPLLRVLASSKHTDGRNMRYSRRVGRSQNLQVLRYWANASAAPTEEEALEKMKDTLVLNYESRDIDIDFTEPAPLHALWDKRTDYRYYLLWNTRLSEEQREALHLPTLDQVKVELTPREEEPAEPGQEEVVIPVKGEGRVVGIVKTKEEQAAWDKMLREGEKATAGN
jgi:hypothetical protein